jgi:hypothetical protein
MQPTDTATMINTWQPMNYWFHVFMGRVSDSSWNHINMSWIEPTQKSLDVWVEGRVLAQVVEHLPKV